MNNIFEYINWHGRHSFDEAPFSGADSLICCLLSYAPLDGIACGQVSLADAYARLAERARAGLPCLNANDDRLFRALLATRRYGALRLSGFINSIDDAAEKQFSAVTLSFEGGFHYIACRGTDNTFTGWKESFNLSFRPTIPSQADALRYLEAAARRLSGGLIVGGHSKGGNLAVYAALHACAEARGRLLAVYNHDGPGQTYDVAAMPSFEALRPRIHTFVPESSRFGMLFRQDRRDVHVVKSREKGFLQHDPYSWATAPHGQGFVLLDHVDRKSERFSLTQREWFARIGAEQRALCVNALYSVFLASGHRMADDFLGHMGHSAAGMLKGLCRLGKKARRALLRALIALIRARRRSRALLKNAERHLVQTT